MVQSTTQSCSPWSSDGIPITSIRFCPSSDNKFVSLYVRNTGSKEWKPVNMGLKSMPTLQQVRDADRNILLNSGSYENAHFYIRSAEGNNVTTAFYTNAQGGAIQSGNGYGYVTLNLQPLGGMLTYGGDEVATQTWVKNHTPNLQQVATAGNSFKGDLVLGAAGSELYIGSGPAGKGDGNTRLGSDTLKSLVSGSWNTAIGSGALACQQYGVNNVAVGEVAMLDFIGVQGTFSNNTAVGDSAGLGMTQGLNNVLIGANTGCVGETPRPRGDKNTILGAQAGYTGFHTNTTGSTATLGSKNIFIGYLAGSGPYDSTLSDQLRIGSIEDYNTDKHIISGTMVQGAQALTFNASVTVPSLGGDGNKMVYVDNNGKFLSTAMPNYSVPSLQQVATVGNSFSGDLILGAAGSELYVGSGPAGKGDGNTRLGSGTLKSLVSGSWNTAIGSGALASMQYSINNVSVGEYSMPHFIGTPGSFANNTVLGDSSANGMTQGIENVIVGASAGFCGGSLRPRGDGNTFVGTGAGNASTIAPGTTALGSYNIFMGNNAGGGPKDSLLSNQLRIGNITNYTTDKHIISGNMIQGAQALTFNASVTVPSLGGGGNKMVYVDNNGQFLSTTMPNYSVPSLEQVATVGNTFNNGIALNGSDIGSIAGVALTINKNHGVHMAIGGAGWQSSTIMQTGYDSSDYLTLRAPSYGNWNATNWLKLNATGQAWLPEGQITTREWTRAQNYLTSFAETDPVYIASIANQLMYKGSIPGSADLNTYTTTGVYHQQQNTSAANGSNYPVPYAGKLEVVNASINFFYQTYHVYKEFEAMYFRSYYSGTWSPWKKITTSADNGNFILSQNSVAQPASAWISGNMQASQFVGGYNSFAISDASGYWGFYNNTNFDKVATAKMGALAISNNYSVNPPTNGLYVRGAIQLDKETNNLGGGAISFYNTTFKPWQIYMGRAGDTNSGAYGNITAQAGSDVTTWALRSYVENTPGYGWVWESGTNTQIAPGISAELSSSTGNFRVAGQLRSGSLSGSGNVSLFADNNGIIRSSNITPATMVGPTTLSDSGWVSIAYNGDGANNGTRASGKFTLVETASGRHITLSFYASYHYGAGWNIVLENGSQYAGSPIISAIRILGNSVYSGAELQVYLLNPPVSLSVIVDENYQKSGWTLVTPISTQVIAGLSEKAKIELISIGSTGSGLVYPVNSYTGFSAETDWFYTKKTGKGWWNVAHNAGIYAVADNEVRTISNSGFRVGDAGGGYVRMEHGDASYAGFFTVYNADDTRNGYVGYKSNMMNYVAERGLHQFTGNGTNPIMSLLPSSTTQTELLTMGSADAGNYSMTLYNNTALQSFFTAANANAYVTGTAIGDSGVRFKNTYVWGPSNGGNAYMYLNASSLKVDIPIIPFTTPAPYTGSWQVIVKDAVTSQMKTIDSSWLSSNNMWNYSGPTGQWIEPISSPNGYSGIITKGFASSGVIEKTASRTITDDDKVVLFDANCLVVLPAADQFPGRELTFRTRVDTYIVLTTPVFDIDNQPYTQLFGKSSAALQFYQHGAFMMGGTLQIQSIQNPTTGNFQWYIIAVYDNQLYKK